MGWLQNIWIERQKAWIITSLLPKNTPDGIPQVPLRADEDYVSIDLASLRIVKVRNGWSKFYGVVHSRVALPYLDDKATAEFNTVTVPAMRQDIIPLARITLGHAKLRRLFIGFPPKDTGVDRPIERTHAIVMLGSRTVKPIDGAVRPRNKTIRARGDVNDKFTLSCREEHHYPMHLGISSSRYANITSQSSGTVNCSNQAFAQLCAFPSPEVGILSDMGMLRQLRIGSRPTTLLPLCQP
jgi:hypothetical protein